MIIGASLLLGNSLALPSSTQEAALNPSDGHFLNVLAGVKNEGSKCWSKCGGGGKCTGFCGSSGACCKKGHDDPGCGILGSNGCSSKHCCSPYTEESSQANDAPRECKATGITSFSVVPGTSPIEVVPGTCIIDPQGPVTLPVTYRDFDYGESSNQGRDGQTSRAPGVPWHVAGTAMHCSPG